MDCSPAIAWLRDAESRYIFLNKTYQDRFGVVEAECLGRRPEDLWPPEIAQAFIANDRAVIAAGKPLQLVEQAPDPDGSIHFWLNIKFPFTDDQGATYVGGVGVDITAQKQEEEERLRQEARRARMLRLESLGLMAAGAAHDFRNFLSIILGNAAVARSTLDPIAPALESVRMIESAAEQMSDLCQQLLTFAGRLHGATGPVDLNAVVLDSVRLLRSTIPSTIATRYQLAGDLPRVAANEAQVRQMVINLVMNAVEALGQQQGSVVLSTRLETPGPAELEEAGLVPTPRPFAVLEVTDDGPGIPRDDLARIFEPFYSSKGEGRGLGLAAVAGIVRSHGGLIQVRSTVGRGSTFRLLLPLAAD